MKRASFADMWCSVAQCLDIIGDSWTVLVVREAFAGRTRFEEIRDRLGIPRNTLNERLHSLVERGILERTPYSQRPPRYDYRLTEAGRDLWPVLCAIRQWGDHHGRSGRPPVRLVHHDCGGPALTLPTCTSCGEHLTPEDTVLGDLTGTPWDPAPATNQQPAPRRTPKTTLRANHPRTTTAANTRRQRSELQFEDIQNDRHPAMPDERPV